MNKPTDTQLGRRTRWSLWLTALSIVMPFAMWLALLISLKLIPPTGWGGLARLVYFMMTTILIVAVLQLISLGFGMSVARHWPRALWWVVPQMALVLSLLGILNVWMSVAALEHAGWVTGVSQDQIAFVAFPFAVVGAVAVTVCWTRWLLAKVKADQTNEMVARESDSLKQVEV